MTPTTDSSTHIHRRTCHLCEAICGVKIAVRDGRILSVRGDDEDPFSRGHVCPKVVGLKDIHEDPERLREPMRRTANGWEKISWDAAFELAVTRLDAIRKQHGHDAIALYFGNPTVHSYSAFLGGIRFARSLRTRNRYSATSVDQLPHHYAVQAMYGHQFLLPIPDLDRTGFFLLIGCNPVVSNGSLMTVPDVTRRLKDLRARGGTLVVVDPRRTETAEISDRHLFVRPGTDAWLLLAMLQVIFAEGRERLGRLDAFVDGLDAVRAACRDITPEIAAGATGIEAEEIRRLAREFATAPTAVCHGRMGVSTQEFGALTQWLIQVLNVVTGNLDRSGGAMFTKPAFDLVSLGGGPSGRGASARKTRVSGLAEFGGEFPVAALAEEIDTPGDGKIRALVTSAGNPVLSTPNGRRLDRALPELDFMLSIDFYLNETTRHAHLILPPTFALERDHYDVIFHALAIRNTAKYCPPLFERAATARHDHEIFAALTEGLEARDAGKRKSAFAMLRDRWLTPRRTLALALRFGPHGARWNPFSDRISLRRLLRHPEGVDLGPLEPCLPARLRTPDRRVQLAPAPMLADLQRLAQRRNAVVSGDVTTLLLIGRRDPRTNNSWLHNSARLVKGPRRCTLRMHPQDATRLAIEDGSMVEVKSRTGAIRVPLEITAELSPGVVSMPHGWGHDRPGMQLSIASAHAGASINDLTDERLVDALSGNAALNGVPVTVQRIDERAA